MPNLPAVLNFVADLLVLGSLAGMAVFIVSYVGFYHWRKTPAGRAVFYVFLSALFVALIASLARWAGPEFPLREWLRLAAWGFFTYAAWNIVSVLWGSYDKGESPLTIPPKRSSAE